MDRRLAEIYEKLLRLDAPDDSVDAISELEAEATVHWLPQLHAWLEQPGNFFLRESVAPAVIRLDGMAALPRLIAALRMGFEEGHDCDGLQAAIFDLVESEPRDAARALVPMADSASAADRKDAAWLLGFVPSEAPADTLLRLASDAEPTVRSAACGSLATLVGSESAFVMLGHRLSDPDSEVRASAASSLGYLGDRRALPLLEQRLAECSASERTVIEFAIGQLPR